MKLDPLDKNYYANKLCQGKYEKCQGPICSLWKYEPNGYTTYKEMDCFPPMPIWNSLPPISGKCTLG